MGQLIGADGAVILDTAARDERTIFDTLSVLRDAVIGGPLTIGGGIATLVVNAGTPAIQGTGAPWALDLNGGTFTGVPAWGGLVYVNTSVPAGNTNANSNAENAFASNYTIGANTLAASTLIRVKLLGVYGTTLIAPTLRGRFKLGGTTVLDTGALTTIASVTNGGWSAEAYIIVNSIGAAGAFECQGYAQFSTAATTGLSANVANTATVAINTTIAEAITVTTQWGTADAANTITLRQMAVEIMRVIA